jgi:hypothetical protein
MGCAEESREPKEHGVSFEEARTAFFDEHARVIADAEHSEDEDRFGLLGLSAQLRVRRRPALAPDKEALRQKWLADDDPWAARAGWSLTSERIAKSPEGLDLPALLERIETEMGTAEPAVQWTMNSCLAAIGIHFPKYRKRAVAIGEALGVYRDYPVSKGCTSPFAPIWINAMVSRKD